MNISKPVASANQTDIPMQETNFWKYLDEGNWDEYAYDAIHAYLRDHYLYERGKDICDKHIVENLFTICNHFTHIVMRPIWRHNE